MKLLNGTTVIRQAVFVQAVNSSPFVAVAPSGGGVER